jgi:hypothetical protein
MVDPNAPKDSNGFQLANPKSDVTTPSGAKSIFDISVVPPCANAKE